jgi:glycosyltransferase involved in cell wall biosynthesis
MTLSAIVLTRNEEHNIKDCLDSLAWADEVLIVDSGSADRTIEIAKARGARTFFHPFTDFAAQRNFAMSQAAGDWILFVDADERVTPELAKEIVDLISPQHSETSHVRHSERSEESHQKQILRHETAQDDENQRLAAYAIPRVTYFFGSRLKFGDARNDAPIRLFPKNRAAWAQPVHEKIETALPLKQLGYSLLHYSTRDLMHYQQKIRDYVPHELEVMRKKGARASLFKAIFFPPSKFLQLYFLKLGILDGIAGLQYAILSSYYTFKKHWLYWKQR